MRALEKRALFEDGTNLFRWSSRIMFRLFVTEYRRRTKFETRYDPYAWVDRLSMDPCQEAVVDLGIVRRAMRCLPRQQRVVIVLVCLHGLSYEDVSRALRVPVGTVRSRLSRAREQLHALLDSNAVH